MAPPYGEPDWATPSESQAAATSNAGLGGAAPINISSTTGTTSTSNQRYGGVGLVCATTLTTCSHTTLIALSVSLSLSLAPKHSEKAKCYVYLFSVVNLSLAGLMIALAVLNLLEFRFFFALQRSFLNVYMVIFSVLLFCSELVWWKPLPLLNKTFRKNFGFLYGLKGKGFFLIFTALLTLGLMDDSSQPSQKWLQFLMWGTGIAWLAAGLIHVGFSCTMPEINQAYQPPTDGLTGDDDANGEGYNNPV